MIYTAQARESYPEQDERSLLTTFAAEVINNRCSTVGEGASEQARQHVEALYDLGLLGWSEETRADGIVWRVEGPGEYRGMNAAPGLDWIQPFGYDAKAAREYAASCRTVGIPHRLSWHIQVAGDCS